MNKRATSNGSGVIGPGRRHAGLTLIETLVVIGIIGVLVGLLLPAVQSVRENARANACRSNLSQLWLAAHTYQDAFHVYPAGTLSDRTPVRDFPDGYHHGWLVRIRGETDGGTIFTEKLDSSQSIYAPANWKLRQDFHLGIFVCPSSPVGWGDVATTYAAIHDGRIAPIDETSRGAFIANRFLRRSDFADGLSTTLFLAEKRVVPEDLPDLGWLSGTQATLRTTGIPLDFDHSRRGTGSSPSVSTPYGYFREKDPQSYEEFVRAVAGDPALDLESLDSDEWEAIDERMRTAPLPMPAVDSEEDEDAPTGSEPDPSGGQYDEYYDEMGMYADAYWEDEYGSTFPAPQVGPGGVEPRGLGSYHQLTVHGVTGDGNAVVISSTVDAEIFAGMGIRDDAKPLVLPRHMQR